MLRTKIGRLYKMLNHLPPGGWFSYARKEEHMIITGMSHYESVCKKKLVEWYNRKRPETPIDLSNV